MRRDLKMPTSLTAFVLAMVVWSLSVFTHATTPASDYQFKGGYPVGDTVSKAYDASDLRRAIEAYKFFMPTLATEAMMQQAETYRPKDAINNTTGIKFKASPRHQVLTGNADTPYAWSVLDLTRTGPVVIDMPKGSLIGFLVDHNMRWITDLGLIGVDKGNGGKYLILPPNYKGEIPEGYYVHQSNTWKIMPFMRSMSRDGNQDLALEAFDQLNIYPLAQADNPSAYNYVDLSEIDMPLPFLAWEDTLEYWRQLHAIVDAETSPDGFRPMLGMLAVLGIEKGKPFNPDARVKRILLNASHIALAEMRANAYDNRRTDRDTWPDRNWQWIPVRLLNGQTKDYGTPEFLDLEGIDNIIFQGWGATVAAGHREPGAGSLYFGTYFDSNNVHFDGGKSYLFTVPAPVPASFFWSATIYDVDTRSLIATDQNKASISSLYDNVEPNENGEIDIYFGPEPPQDRNAPWVKTIPGKGWFIFIRVFGPQPSAFDGTWRLNNIEPLVE